jgi:ribonuclease Z
MSLAEGFAWEYKDWRFSGYSLAGITTSIFCRTAGVCFDLGQGLPFQLGAKRVLISHAHMDHAAGIPYLIAQRNMAGQADTEIFLPEGMMQPMEEILQAWQRIDGHSYSYSLKAAPPGQLISLDKLYSIKAFRTDHRVPSQGYILYLAKKRLKERFRDGESAAEARRRGDDPDERFFEPVVAYTGDSRIEFLEADPDVRKAKILFAEATFWGEKKPVDHARKWGHTHFDEILTALSRFENERIVLIHASARYSSDFLEAQLAARLSAADRKRVVLFPRPF